LVFLLCYFCFYSYLAKAEEFIVPGSEGTTKHTIGDDRSVPVDIPFEFTLYDKTFTHSYMHSNGVVAMVAPNTTFTHHLCCNGLDIATMAANGQLPGQPYFNYTIAALWTDLIDLNVDVDGDGIDDSGFFTKEMDTNDDGQMDTLRYYWRHVSEYYDNSKNSTFGLEINDSNVIEIHHFDINVINHDVTVGVFGDTNNGDFEQFKYTTRQEDFISNTSTTYFNLEGACNANPLISTLCNGYAETYATLLFNQSCAADALYDPTCPGYEQKYYETYIEPTLEEQANEAAGVDTDFTDDFDDFDVEDPVASLTEVSVTGDATVDEVLRDTQDVITTTVLSDEFERISLEEGLEDDRMESDSDVDERDSEREDSGSNESEVEISVRDESEDMGDRDATTEEFDDAEVETVSTENRDTKKEKMKKVITKRATMLAERMSKAATFEMQQAVQGQVLALINYIPDFTRYGGNIQGGYYPENNVLVDGTLPENNRGLRNGLAQQLLHEKMIDMQYK